MALHHEPSRGDPAPRHSAASEPLRLEAQARARAAHELDVLRARSADLHARLRSSGAHAGLGRRALGAVVGSSAWERMLEHADALLRSRAWAGRSVALYVRGAPGELEATLTAERARMGRLARRARAYEAGLGELSRALAAAWLRLPGGLPRRLASHERADGRRTATGRLRLPPRPFVRPREGVPPERRVTAIVPCCGPRDAARGVRALLREGLGRELAIVGRRRSFGPSAVEAVELACTPYVLVSGAALPGPSAVERLVEVLETDAHAAAVSARVVSAETGGAIDGGWSFDWSAGAPLPILAPAMRDAPSPAAIGGSCVLLRRAALAGCEIPAAYRDRLWAVDLSLQLQSRGWGVRLADVAATGRGTAKPADGDLELLLDRWGGRLSSLVLRDSVAGGGRWSARRARVVVSEDAPPLLRAACEVAGWELIAARSAAPDLMIAIDAAGRVSATVCSVGVRSPALLGAMSLDGGDPSAAAAVLRERLLASLDRPSLALHVGDRDEAAARRGGDFYLADALARELGERGHHACVRTAGDRGARARGSTEVRVTVRGRRRAAASPGQLNLLWIISHPGDVEAAELADADGVLVASEPYTRQISARTSTPVRTLLQFADPEVFRAAGSPRERHEILFVGNWRGAFRRAVWDARHAGFRVALVGQGWRYLAPDDVIADHVAHHQLGALYSSTKVLLADHWDDMRDEGFISNRIFDALACGSFVITDDVAGLRELLPDGVEVYSGAEQLGARLRHYLSDEAARRRVAERGRQLALEHHTVRSRVDELLAAVSSAAAESGRMAVDHLADGDCGRGGARQSLPGAASSEA